MSLLTDIIHNRFNKMVHISAAFLLSIIGLLIFRSLLVLIIVLLIGIVKESYDSFRPGDKFDIKDFSMDCIGIALAYVCWVVTRSL